MSAGEDFDGLALAACVCVMLALVLVLVCLDSRDEQRDRENAQHRPGGPDAPPPAPRRSPAKRCDICHLPVRYENHPAGQKDAMRLHQAYECTATPARRNSR